MSSQSHTMAGPSPKTKPGEVELTGRFSDQMAQLCMSDDYSDVTFIVEEHKIPAHRVILAARSEYFRALLYGGLSETTQHDIRLEIPLEAFKCLLGYIYSGFLSLSQMKEENVLDTLGLANQYGFSELELAISEYLRQILSLENVCAILDAARLYSLDPLINVCHTFMDRNATAMLVHESFKNLSQDSLCGVLKRDSFFAPEVLIFGAVSNWCKVNQTTDIEVFMIEIPVSDIKYGTGQSVVSEVRLPLMNLEQLLKVVRPSGILSPERLLDAIEEKTTSKTLLYRGALWPEENVAAHRFGSKMIVKDTNEYRPELLEDNHSPYDMEKGYTRHTISDRNDEAITVELGTISIINHVKILLWDKDNRSYSYFIEVSVNQKQWDRVVDYHEYYCRSWQYLYFAARAVRYIKLVGTHNTENKVFHVVSINAKYTETIPTLINGIISPVKNVATVEMSASVIKGVSRTRNNLLNGDTKTYDWDSGYTCHQLGSGEILIQLSQPYHIGSLRLLLWDCDDRTYSFYIQTSTNAQNWEMAVDKQKEHLRSWQQFTFEARPVVFFKIVGTYNTANEIFHCVHFECPSQELTQ